MPKYTLTYLNEDLDELGVKSVITAANEEEAVIKFSRLRPSDCPYVTIQFRFGKFKTVSNPLMIHWEEEEAQRQEEEAQRQEEEAQRQEEEIQRQEEEAQQKEEEAQRQEEAASITKLINHLEKQQPEELEFCQLEEIISNFFNFPKLRKGNGNVEIYKLREKLYMLSFCNTKIQAGIQTRFLSQIASVTSAPQTGSSGSGQPKWAPLAAVATMSKLGNIETDVDDMADGFFGED
ncbi:hypothetical protein N8504_03020 [Akkermansiaceae bacterium]|nr:hypothetical protein [Akkermansiaceae bacterium]